MTKTAFALWAAVFAAAIVTPTMMPRDSAADAVRKISSSSLYIAGIGGHFATADVCAHFYSLFGDFNET